MSIMNPNYLYKDELEYELGTRCVSSLGDVQLLRKILRSIQAEEVPSNIQNLWKFDVGNCLRVCKINWRS
jgi:hypothetical protein